MKNNLSVLLTEGKTWRQFAKFGIAPETAQKGKQALNHFRHKRCN
jgi:hypothetical protein